MCSVQTLGFLEVGYDSLFVTHPALKVFSENSKAENISRPYPIFHAAPKARSAHCIPGEASEG